MSTNQPKTFIERIANTLTGTANSKILYSEPVEQDGTVIIPVSRIRYGFGGGVGSKSENGEEKAGKGAGGGVDAQPIGYIEMRDGEVKFRAINKPISIPTVILAGGFASWLVIRGLTRLFRK